MGQGSGGGLCPIDHDVRLFSRLPSCRIGGGVAETVEHIANLYQVLCSWPSGMKMDLVRAAMMLRYRITFVPDRCAEYGIFVCRNMLSQCEPKLTPYLPNEPNCKHGCLPQAHGPRDARFSLPRVPTLNALPITPVSRQNISHPRHQGQSDAQSHSHDQAKPHQHGIQHSPFPSRPNLG